MINTASFHVTYMSNEVDGSNANVHNVSMEFKAAGYSLNQIIDRELYINPNPTVYEDAETFLDDVVREVNPTF